MSVKRGRVTEIKEEIQIDEDASQEGINEGLVEETRGNAIQKAVALNQCKPADRAAPRS